MKALPKFLLISALLILTSGLLTNVAFSGQIERYGYGLAETPGVTPSFFFLPVVGFSQTYSVSGQVTDQNNQPISDASVVDNAGRIAMTDGSGYYTIGNLPAGNYALAPSKSGYVFSPSVKDVNLPGATNVLDFTAIQQCSELIENGGFENNAFWEMPITPYPSAYTTSAAHSGDRSVRTGIVNPADNVYSYSSTRPKNAFKVPSDSETVTLRLWLYPVTGEAATTANQVEFPVGFDFASLELAPQGKSAVLSTDLQYIVVLNENNQVIKTLLTMLSDASQWQLYEFDLSQYAGDSIKIHVGTFNNGGGGVTHMFVDDVSIEACPESDVPPTPTPTPTNTPPGPTPTPSTCSEIMLNNSFENDNGWIIPITEFSAGYSTTREHSGLRSMRTGIEFPTHNRYSYSDFRQVVTIPANSNTVQLDMWIWSKSQEAATAAASNRPVQDLLKSQSSGSDVQYVLILNSFGYWIDTLLWQLSDARTWELKSFDLSNYAGSTIKIQPGTYNNGWGGVTSMFVDDMTLEVCP